MLTTMNPSSSSACASPRAGENERDPTLPLCGPGYALLTIGYFLDVSKVVGLNISPYRSVFPSAALTLIRVGGFQPRATSREMSAFSSSITSFPAASRSSTAGGTSALEYVSTRYFPDGES